MGVFHGMDGRMDGCAARHGWTDRWVCSMAWMDGWMGGQIDEFAPRHGWMDKWVCSTAWMDGWMDGRMVG